MERINKKIKESHLALIVSLLLSGQAYAVGTGSIASGSGSINKTDNTTTVTQNSDKLIVNWNNMDVSRNKALNFKQKTTDSVLNRITSSDPTRILGAMNAASLEALVKNGGFISTSDGNIMRGVRKII